MANQYPNNEDTNDNPWVRKPAPPDPKLVRMQRASTFGAAVAGLPTEARDQMRTILSSLANIEEAGSGMATAYIRNLTTEDQQTTVGGVSTTRRIPKKTATSDQIASAQKSLNAQREIVATSSTAAKDAFTALKPAVLAGVISTPDNATDAQIADRKEDLAVALEAAGRNGANAKAQALIHQAVKEGDQLTAYCLCSDPLKFRADSLGVNQQTLQSVYANAQMAKVGLNPLMGLGAVPGGALIQLFPDIQTLISETSSGATQALDALAKECKLN